MTRNLDQRLALRAAFIETLADYIDARINYGNGDPEWRSGRETSQAADRLDDALAKLLLGNEEWHRHDV